MISTLISDDDNFTVHFPRLMKSTINPELIVLFTAPAVGTVVSESLDDTSCPLGHHDSLWNAGAFEVFNGELSLINESDDGEYGDDESDGCAGCTGCDRSPVPECATNGSSFAAAEPEVEVDSIFERMIRDAVKSALAGRANV